MTARLYGLPGAPPSMAAQLMLEHKGVAYERKDLVTLLHGFVLRRRGFSGGTAPALELDGRRVQTNRAIARALDEVAPDPPLFPREPEQRAAVEEAEALIDDRLQPTIRRVALATLRDAPEAFEFHPKLGPLGGQVPPLVPRGVLLRYAIAHYGGEEAVERAQRDLPGLLDRMDRYAEQGVLNGDTLNAADFQGGVLVRLLMGIDGLGVARRPIARLARRILA